ncbi:branched-chain amino acid transport system permease protein [Bradyrhizobium diazoefficiens]
MSLAHDARVAVRPADLAERSARAWPEIDNPAAWIVAVLLLIMPLIANGFFLIEIFATTLILGIMALSLMFLAGYGGMVSLMQLTIAGFAAYMVAVFGVSANTNISLGWPWWLAVPVALALATVFGTLGGALAVRTEGIYTIMITLAIGAAFYYFTNQNWAIFNGHTGINTVATPHFWGVNWRADIPFYYIVLAVAALCYFAVDYISRAPFGLALQGVRDNPRRMAALGFNVNAHRVAAYAFASFVAALAGVLQVWNYRQISPGSVSHGRRLHRRADHRRGRRHHAPDRSLHRRADLRAAAHLRARCPDQVRARRQPLPAADRARLPRHRILVLGRRDRPVAALAPEPSPYDGPFGRSARPWIASPSASPPSAPAPRSSCAA